MLMSEDLRDLGQRRASTKHLRRRSVAETMCAPMHNARTAEGALRDALDPSDSYRGIGCVASNEHGARGLVSRRSLEVARDRLSDIDREWQARARTAFAADRDLTHPPVDLVEPDCRYFTSTQAQSNHQQQRCVVPEPDKSTAIACREDCSDLGRLEAPRQRALPPAW
jgi:hypothetical protein